jgi:hypothetical protein
MERSTPPPATTTTTPEDPEEAEVVVVDMRERRFYDRKLLTRFYDELMVPAFGQFEDELESLDSWVEHFEAPQQQQHSAESDSPAATLHVLLVLRLPSTDAAVSPPPQRWHEVDSGIPFSSSFLLPLSCVALLLW